MKHGWGSMVSAQKFQRQWKENMNRINRRICGFTLIELLIVVAIIGILAAIAVPNFLNAQTRAKVARAESDLRSIKTALEMYRVDNNTYLRHTGAYNYAFELAPLTTPIAYLATIPPDPFVKKYDKSDYSWTLHGGYYTYQNCDEEPSYCGSTSMPYFRELFLRGTKYFLWSVGPDGLEGFSGPGQPYNMFQYSMSNGLKSPGDIIVYAP